MLQRFKSILPFNGFWPNAWGVFEILLFFCIIIGKIIGFYDYSLSLLLVCITLLLPLPFNQNYIWLSVDWIFQKIDDFGRRIILRQKVDINKWKHGFAERRPLLKMAAFGCLLISTFAYSKKPLSFSPVLSNWMIKNIPDVERWEWAVFFWSATFLLIFIVKEIFEYSDDVKKSAGAASRMGFVFAFIVTFITVLLIVLMLTPGLPALLRLLAELGLCILIVIKGILFARLYRKHADLNQDCITSQKSKNFVEALVLIDLPGVVAFGALYLYGYMRFDACDQLPANIYIFKDMFFDGWSGVNFHESSRPAHAFASGAAALNLILINVSYISLSIWQIYEDTPDQAVTLKAEDTHDDF